MKKNKNTTFILLFIVAALWGVVIYRLYKSFFSEEKLVDVSSKIEKRVIKTEVNEKFSLLANYSDPFFGYNLSKKNKDVNTNSFKKIVKSKKEKIPEAPINWSFISYIGLIKNKDSQKQIALVSIHGKEYMVSEGDQLNEVSFLKNYKDSIKVSYKGKTTYLRKI